MQIKITSKNNRNKHIFIFLFFEPDKDLPWSYVSLCVIENQDSRSSILKICWMTFDIFFSL